MNKFHPILIISIIAVLALSGCDMGIYTGPEAKTAPINRTLHISSDPEGFLIWQDGINYGFNTPDSLTWIQSDTIEITLSKKYFRDSVFVVVFDTNNKKISKHIDFSTNPSMKSSISCESTPTGAAITLDGVETNFTTPHVFTDLMPGYHELSFSLQSHESKYISLFLYSNTLTQEDITLADSSVWVIYNEDKYGIPLDKSTSVNSVNGTIYFGLNNSGLAKLNNGILELLTEESSILPDNFISCIISSENTILVGTYGGLYEIKDGQEKIYTSTNSGLMQNEVTDIFIARENKYLIGTTTTFYIFDGQEWQSWNSLNSNIPEAEISTVIEDDTDDIWIGNNLGIAKLVNNSWVTYTGEDFYNSPILCKATDKNGVCYLAYLSNETNNYSVVSRSAGNWQKINEIQLAYKINGMSFDNENNIWLATDDGLIKFDGNFTQYTMDNSLLPGNILSDVHCDEYENVWITTSIRGVVKFKPYNL